MLPWTTKHQPNMGGWIEAWHQHLPLSVGKPLSAKGLPTSSLDAGAATGAALGSMFREILFEE